MLTVKLKTGILVLLESTPALTKMCPIWEYSDSQNEKELFHSKHKSPQCAFRQKYSAIQLGQKHQKYNSWVFSFKPGTSYSCQDRQSLGQPHYHSVLQSLVVRSRFSGMQDLHSKSIHLLRSKTDSFPTALPFPLLSPSSPPGCTPAFLALQRTSLPLL